MNKRLDEDERKSGRTVLLKNKTWERITTLAIEKNMSISMVVCELIDKELDNE